MDTKQAVTILAVIAVIIPTVAIGFSVLDSSGMEDARGRKVHIPDNVDTVLPLNCCSLQLVSYFDMMDKVVAIDTKDLQSDYKTYTKVFEKQFKDKEKVSEDNIEKIIELSPSLIITSTVSVSDLNNLQKRTGIPVYAINADLEFGDQKWFDQILNLGKIFHKEDRAMELVNAIKQIIDEVSSSKLTEKVTGYVCGMKFFGSAVEPVLRTTGDWLPFEYVGITNIAPTSDLKNKQPYDCDYDKLNNWIEAAGGLNCIFVDNSNLEKTREGLSSLSEKGIDISTATIYHTTTYKDWGTQFDAVLIDIVYIAENINGSSYHWGSFEEKANEILKLLYGDGLSYSELIPDCNKCDTITL